MSSLLKCMHDGHGQKQIQSICLNQECQNVRLLCHACLKQFHSDHVKETEDWADFKKWNEQRRNENLILEGTLQSIRQNVESLINVIQNINQNLLVDINSMTTSQLETQVKTLLMIQNKKVSISQSLDQANEFLIKVNNSFKEFASLYKYNKKLLFIRDNTQINQKDKQRSNLQVKGKRSKSFQQDSFIELSIQDSMQIEEISDVTIFSKLDKSANINIFDEGKRAKNDVLGGFCICLPSKNWYNCLKLQFQIKKLNTFGMVHIGLCNRQHLKVINFDPDLTKVGHGLYLVNNFGFAFSTKDKQINNVKKAFNFAENDEITIRLCGSSITWKKNQFDGEFIMPICNEKELYPCVGLYFAEIVVRDCIEQNTIEQFFQ